MYFLGALGDGGINEKGLKMGQFPISVELARCLAESNHEDILIICSILEINLELEVKPAKQLNMIEKI